MKTCPVQHISVHSRRLRLIMLAIVCGALGLKAVAYQSWQNLSLEWLDTDRVTLNTSAEWRITDEVSDFSYWRIRQEATTELRPWLKAGVAYRYTESKNSQDLWRHQHRAEFELTPRWKIDGQVTLSLRNRYEIRWNEGVGGRNQRTRHRLQLGVTTPQWRPLQSIYFNHEAIYDWDRRDIIEHRTVPLGMDFRLSDNATFRIYYLLRSTRSWAGWDRAHVIGTSLSLSL